MKIFAGSAAYYDLLYREKDYKGESDYVLDLIGDNKKPGTILELGCGTARHTVCLAQSRWDVCGVDLSEEMLCSAQERIAAVSSQVAARTELIGCDIRELSLDRRFDVVIALFHVLSYQSSNDDLRSVFEVAAKHLRQDGIFVFDFWYGPAVLTQRPQVREKLWSDDSIEVRRIARPRELPNENCVEVNYDFEVFDKATGSVETFQESHRMRYLFLPEIRELLRQVGMEMEFSYEWMTRNEPGFDSWSVCCGAVLS